MGTNNDVKITPSLCEFCGNFIDRIPHICEKKLTIERERRRLKKEVDQLKAQINDLELLHRVMRGLHTRYKKKQNYGSYPYWALIAEYFGMGSTEARKLCCRFGFNPDDAMNRHAKKVGWL